MRFQRTVQCKGNASRIITASCYTNSQSETLFGSQTPVNLSQCSSRVETLREAKRVYFRFESSVFIVFPAFPWILCCQNVQKCCVNKLRSVQQKAHWSSLKIEKINTKSVLNCVYKWLGIVSWYTYESGPRNSLGRGEKEK